MKYFLDSEFIENGITIDLISIGIVREDGQQFYAISNEFNAEAASLWVREHVLIHLPTEREVKRYANDDIREMIEGFMEDDPKPEIWGYYADYDWVLFCQLWGRMIDLPDKFPRYCRDLKQLADELGVTLPKPDPELEHQALYDAIWIKEGYEICQQAKSCS